MRNGTGSPLISYADLAQRWGMSKATVCRYLKKLSDLGYLSLVSFPGTHGTAIYLQNYLSTMFQISDVMLDKDEIALALHIKVELDSVSQTDSGVSESNMETVLKKVGQILTAQGFPCLSCPKSHCKLLPLSDDCQRAVLEVIETEKDTGDSHFLLVISCGETSETAKFELYLHPCENWRIDNEKR